MLLGEVVVLWLLAREETGASTGVGEVVWEAGAVEGGGVGAK